MTARLSCPDCGTPLRIRDRSLVGRRVNCPECKTELRVDNADRDDGSFVIRKLTKSELADRKNRKGSQDAKAGAPATTTAGDRLRNAVNSPLTAIWLVGLAAIALVAVIALNPKLRFASSQLPNRPGTSRATATEREVPVDSAPPEQSQDSTTGPDADLSTSVPLPQPASDVMEPPVTALEPANLDEPLPWPPAPVAEHEIPPEPAASESVVRIDVESKLSQKIVLYKQPKVSRRLLIDALQEQLGIPIRYDIEDLGESSLDEKIAFELHDTTLGDIVNTVAKSAEWRIEVEETGLRLTRQNVSQSQ